MDDIAESAQRLRCIDYLCNVASLILNSLKWTKALDCTHAFWTGTNLRPTIYKLFDFTRMILDSEPDNLRALWLHAVKDTFWGTNNFGQEWWLRLWQMNRVDVRC